MEIYEFLFGSEEIQLLLLKRLFFHRRHSVMLFGRLPECIGIALRNGWKAVFRVRSRLNFIGAVFVYHLERRFGISRYVGNGKLNFHFFTVLLHIVSPEISFRKLQRNIQIFRKYVIITSRISKKSKILRASENIVSSIWAIALRLCRTLRFAQ